MFLKLFLDLLDLLHDLLHLLQIFHHGSLLAQIFDIDQGAIKPSAKSLHGRVPRRPLARAELDRGGLIRSIQECNINSNGLAEHLRTFSREAIVEFRARQWSPERGGAFLAGDLSHVDDGALPDALSRFASRDGTPAADPAPEFERRVLVEARDSQQSHLRLHWRPRIEPGDLRQRAALTVLSTLLGGSMGSRLFDEIREQRGLCYAIRSHGWTHADSARLDVSSGLDSTKCAEAYARIREIVVDLAGNGPRDGEVDRARAYTAGSTVLSLESTRAVASRAAGQKVVFGEISSPDETIAALDAVTESDIREVAAQLDGPPVVACVGPHEASEFE